jgi:hypothetical protein
MKIKQEQAPMNTRDGFNWSSLVLFLHFSIVFVDTVKSDGDNDVGVT